MKLTWSKFFHFSIGPLLAIKQSQNLKRKNVGSPHCYWSQNSMLNDHWTEIILTQNDFSLVAEEAMKHRGHTPKNIHENILDQNLHTKYLKSDRMDDLDFELVKFVLFFFLRSIKSSFVVFSLISKYLKNVWREIEVKLKMEPVVWLVPEHFSTAWLKMFYPQIIYITLVINSYQTYMI